MRWKRNNDCKVNHIQSFFSFSIFNKGWIAKYKIMTDTEFFLPLPPELFCSFRTRAMKYSITGAWNIPSQYFFYIKMWICACFITTKCFFFFFVSPWEKHCLSKKPKHIYTYAIFHAWKYIYWYTILLTIYNCVMSLEWCSRIQRNINVKACRIYRLTLSILWFFSVFGESELRLRDTKWLLCRH